ncbi:MAG: Sec-independent protein translocase subunit TatB [Propionibacterium sp.]|nr:Sec-independent protein translocase subunit TatB [Propionibacterium sp.]
MAEIVVLILLGIIFFGPDKVPELARKAARVLHFLRNIANDAKNQLRDELGPEYADLQLSDLNPKTFVAKHLLSAAEIEDFREIRDDLNLLAEDTRILTDEIDEDLKSSDQSGAAAPEPEGEPERIVAFDPEAT